MRHEGISPDIIEVSSWLSRDSLARLCALHEIGIYLMRDFMFYRESELRAVPGLGGRFPGYVQAFYAKHGMGQPFLPEDSRRFPRYRRSGRPKTRGIVEFLVARHTKWGPWCYWAHPILPSNGVADFAEFVRPRLGK